MPYEAKPLDIAPGTYMEASEYAAQGRYVDSENVRWWKGFPESIGGNQEISDTLLRYPARGGIAWRSLSGSQLVAFGHARGVEVFQSSSLTDISPTGTDGYATLTVTLRELSAVSCTITNDNPGVVTAAAHGLAAGSGVRFATSDTLPTGLSPGTTYYVGANVTTNTFSLGATKQDALDGAYINTSGTQSGTHTLSTYFSFTTGETLSTSNGASGKIISADTASPLSIVDASGTLSISTTDGIGTFVRGEVITTVGGGTARVWANVAATGPVIVYGEDGTLSGVMTGSVSGATATISSTTTLYSGLLSGGTSLHGATITGYAEANDVDSGSIILYGEGTYGSSVWGGVETLFSSVEDCETWTFATWGEDLIGCPRGGKIYLLDTSAYLADSTVNMGLMSASAPATALGVVMNDSNRTLIAYGADGDPLNIAWCDEENYTIWTPSASNTAGSIRCETGSTIVGHMEAQDGHLFSTDAAIYTFRYIGLPYVFSLKKVADGASLIGPHASASADGITYWMSLDGFYAFDGSVLPLPCDVHAYVFGRLNTAQAHKVYAETVRAYNEIWWYYPAGTEVDSYVSYNTIDRTWAKGTKARTTVIDSSVVLSYPIGCKASGSINAEEIGENDNGEELSYELQTSDIEIDDGTTFLHSRMLIPNYDRISGSHSLTIECRGWPARAARTKGPFTITSATEKISVRARGRTLRFLFSGTGPFRMGRWRYRVTGHGRKE